ncbi:hypothetical protein [Streptomyces sp. NPDC002328]|uniref:hypothetical protein n=1 Tax=Streptomyces sp. NPDC002328 TaxID=3364642 RepID=UPI0036980CA5
MRFDGWIAGVGTSSGTRIVLGHWQRSPFGPFSDVMLERADGQRLLLAPTRETADFVSETYAFDAVRVTPVCVRVAGATWTVAAGSLELRFVTGRRGLLGLLLRAVPGALARSPAWSALIDRPARLLLPGVRTRGRGPSGRRAWYGARDLWPIRTASGSFEGHGLGTPAPVAPPVRFGFGSVPREPAVTRVTTTVAPAHRRTAAASTSTRTACPGSPPAVL